jgi:ATP-binding cassette, subfamily B, multidrug efflux pump
VSNIAAMPNPQASGTVSLAQLGAILKPWRGVLACVITAVMLGAALEMAPPLIIRKVIDSHVAVSDPSGLFLLAMLYLGAIAAGNLLSFASQYLTALAAQGALHDLRVRLFGHLLRLPSRYHDDHAVGDSISRCTADVDTVNTLFSAGVSSLATDLVRVVAVIAAMVYLSPWLTLVALLVMPPLAFITRRFQVRVRQAERDTRQATGVLNTHLQETLSGAEVIRAFGRDAAFVRRFRLALHALLRVSNRSNLYASLYSPSTAILSSLTTAGLLWLGASRLHSNWEVSIGTLTAFVLLFQRFFKPITALGDEWQTVQASIAGAERIFQVLSLPTDQHAAPALPGTHTPNGSTSSAIVAQSLTFGYLPQRPILHDLSFCFRDGEHVVIVGRSGAGKTTLAQLVCGLYTPWSGQITVAGLDPRRLSDDDRRGVIVVVPQTVQLFSSSVRENLVMADPAVSDADVAWAAKLTGLAQIVAGLPDGYDTVIRGSGRSSGMQLSAGQRQLVALTRALIRRPRVLIMDEANSAIDSASEQQLRLAIREATRQASCCVISIAHRLAAARDADRVVVLDAGRIVEQGPPDQLIAAGGLFAGLLELEASGWDWEE